MSIPIEDSDRLCDSCDHPGLDHGLWMGTERMGLVEKYRRIGCRVIGCGCEEWKSTFQWGVGSE